jgi:hypothetical protein
MVYTKSISQQLRNELDSWMVHWYAKSQIEEDIIMKKVSIDLKNNVMHHIPNREDIDIIECWWRPDDINSFKVDAVKEIREYLSHHRHADSKTAIITLYQPSPSLV